MYRIEAWHPDINKMGGCGFSIKLFKEFKEKVAKTDLTQEKIDIGIKNMSPYWFQYHGYTNTEYERISVRWGEFGPEHITVPGNACGLDKSDFMCDDDEMLLTPHNVDSLRQMSLLLTVFCWVENMIYLQTLKI
ncbi:hypothetical protein [Dyadobacter sp. 3J3]|uniref:hypothetical protein n=1 Tax=Dyadobacter sp. 3J3 TaxID=2606600 RepID=UPI001356952C|nr:hypothetical protein [Dyadobacter sp. 3J3]